MVTMRELDRYGVELGKLIAGRQGLDPNTIGRDWDMATVNQHEVMVTLRVPIRMGLIEFQVLATEARKRARE